VLSGHPAFVHFQQFVALLLEISFLRTRRLRAEHPAPVRIKDEDMRGVRMRRQKLVQTPVTSLSWFGKVFSDVVGEFVSLLVDSLFRNDQHLAEVSLNGRSHCAVALNVLEVV